MKTILVFFMVTLLTACSSNDNIDISKYPMITPVKELAEVYDLRLEESGAYETSALTKYLDGSVELEYSYDLIETQEYDPLFYNITIEKERTVSDAKDMYSLGKGTLNLVGNSFEQGIEEIDSLDLPGDQNYYALRTYEGQPSGMLFKMRKGTVIYTMMISGIYTTDHSLLYDHILPKIEDLESFKIKK